MSFHWRYYHVSIFVKPLSTLLTYSTAAHIYRHAHMYQTRLIHSKPQTEHLYTHTHTHTVTSSYVHMFTLSPSSTHIWRDFLH